MKKKDLILRAADLLFAKKGFKDTSISELAKATDTAEGTIFYHFKNKEELFITILEHFKLEIVGKFDRFLRENKFGSGLEMMEGAISFYIHLAGTMDNRFLLLHRHDAYEMARANTVCWKHLEAIYDCLLDIIERAVVIGQRDGSVRPMLPRKAALIIFSMVDGLVRLNTYNLYHAGALHGELITCCRRILQNEQSAAPEAA